MLLFPQGFCAVVHKMLARLGEYSRRFLLCVFGHGGLSRVLFSTASLVSCSLQHTARNVARASHGDIYLSQRAIHSMTKRESAASTSASFERSASVISPESSMASASRCSRATIT